jgi:hypothetical protein
MNDNFIREKQKKAARAAFLVRPEASVALGCLCAGLAVFLAEFLNAAGGVHDLLGAGVERVALGADFNVQRLAHGGAGCELVAAATVYGDFLVFRMDIGFHFSFPCSKVWRGGGTRSVKGVDYPRKCGIGQPPLLFMGDARG